MTDLDRFIEAVEAGYIGTPRDAIAAIEAALGGLDGYRDGVAMNVVGAFIGSLDAAKRLKDVIAPGVGCAMNLELGLVRLYGKGLNGSIGAEVEGNPARAWLLAILRAVKAKG